jgi:hypothetical protein
MKGFLAVLLTTIGIGSAQAYTCDDVRALSPGQQAYYIKVYNITPSQQERIRHACYGQGTHHGTTASAEASSGHGGHGERDARAEQ